MGMMDIFVRVYVDANLCVHKYSATRVRESVYMARVCTCNSVYKSLTLSFFDSSSWILSFCYWCLYLTWMVPHIIRQGTLPFCEICYSNYVKYINEIRIGRQGTEFILWALLMRPIMHQPGRIEFEIMRGMRKPRLLKLLLNAMDVHQLLASVLFEYFPCCL